MPQLKEFFYLANIIDYARIVTLYWAVQSSGGTFVFWYAFSYILDIFDGPAARALNQESKLGYYLDMVIDRISSCLCLYFAALSVLTGETCIGASAAPIVAFVLRASLLVVEIIAHGTVCYLAEVQRVHQKKMGFDYAIVRMYLGDRKTLFWACASFEAFGLALIWPSCPISTPVVLVCLPGFVFRAAANTSRLISIFANWRQIAYRQHVPTD